MSKFYLTEEISDKNFTILFEEIDFAKKIAKNADVIGEVSSNKQKVISIVTQIKELKDYREFTNDFLNAIFHKELFKLAEKIGDVDKTNENTKKIIEKVYAGEEFKKIGKDIEIIVKIVSEYRKNKRQKYDLLLLLVEITSNIKIDNRYKKLERDKDGNIEAFSGEDKELLNKLFSGGIVDGICKYFSRK